MYRAAIGLYLHGLLQSDADKDNRRHESVRHRNKGEKTAEI